MPVISMRAVVAMMMLRCLEMLHLRWGTTQTVTIGDGKVGEDWDADEDPAGSALGQTGTEDDVIVAAAVAVTDNVAVVMEDADGYVAAEGVLMHYVIGILHWHRH